MSPWNTLLAIAKFSLLIIIKVEIKEKKMV